MFKIPLKNISKLEASQKRVPEKKAAKPNSQAQFINQTDKCNTGDEVYSFGD